MIKIMLISLLTLCAQGCVVAKVADTAVSVGATTVKTTAKVGAGAIDAVTPDPDKDDDDEKNDNKKE